MTFDNHAAYRNPNPAVGAPQRAAPLCRPSNGPSGHARDTHPSFGDGNGGLPDWVAVCSESTDNASSLFCIDVSKHHDPSDGTPHLPCCHAWRNCVGDLRHSAGAILATGICSM